MWLAIIKMDEEVYIIKKKKFKLARITACAHNDE
jgi:hypothetical protein